MQESVHRPYIEIHHSNICYRSYVPFCVLEGQESPAEFPFGSVPYIARPHPEQNGHTGEHLLTFQSSMSCCRSS